jgi:hypothetical protein
MDLQPYSHYWFYKISRTLFDFLKNIYRVSSFWRNKSRILWTGVSYFSITLFYFTLFCCGGKANLVRLTLFYSTLLTLTGRQKDRQTDRQTEEQIHLLWVGWRNLFSSCAFVLCQFLFWREICFDLHTHVLRVQYSCGVVLVFWFWREIVFGVMYIHT